MGRAASVSIDELISGATARTPLAHTDGKSGSILERVVIDGEPYVLKTLHPDLDWIARVIGDLSCWPVRLWTSGLLDLVPPEIDHAVVGAAGGLGRNRWGGALLMRDVSARLLPEGDHIVALEIHAGFLNHMAALHARFWDFEDELGLMPVSGRYTFFSPAMVETERRLGFPQEVPRVVERGWERFAAVRHPVVPVVLELLADASSLVAALDAGPQTLVQGDWKMGNLGWHPEGRTILLDWAYPGRAPAATDLAWYLSLNAARLPHAKEDAIASYRAALNRRGVPTDPWWDGQLELALLGGVVQFGWEKALGDPAELSWWLERAAEGARRL